VSNWQWLLIQLKHWRHDWGEPYTNIFDYNELLRDCQYEHCTKKRHYTHAKGYWWTTDA
jgi:hypothetical protein